MRPSRPVLAVALLVAAPSFAQEAPSAAELLRRYEAALGGREAVARIATLKKTGTYVYNGLEFPLVSYRAREVKRRDEITGLSQWATEVREGVTVVRATDGQRAWTSGLEAHPGPRLLTPNQTAAALDEARFDAPLLHLDAGTDLDVVGQETVEGEPVWRLRVAWTDGRVEHWSLGAEDGLPRRREVEAVEGRDAYQLGRVWHFDDYRDVAGVPMPHWVHVEESLFAREYVYDRIEADVALEGIAFSPPDDVAPPPSEP